MTALLEVKRPSADMADCSGAERGAITRATPSDGQRTAPPSPDRGGNRHARTEVPPELARLLREQEPAAREAAWHALVSAHTCLILRTVRYGRQDHDVSMDRYAYVLEQLRRDDFRRLRTFVADGRATFTTWLVVVTRRLCLDYERRPYGRPGRRPLLDEDCETRQLARLADLVAEPVDVETVAAHEDDPESCLRRKQLRRVLDKALAALPPRDRALLRLRFEERLPAARLASLLGLPTAFHVYRRLNKS